MLQRNDIKANTTLENELQARIDSLQRQGLNASLINELSARLKKLSNGRIINTAPDSTEDNHTSARLTEIDQKLEEIKQLLSLRATASISYNDITHLGARKKMISDNLRMENAALSIELSDANRFFIFCTNALYQIEDLLNYFYHYRFPQIQSFAQHLVSLKSTYTGTPRKVSDVQTAYKLFAFEKEFYHQGAYFDSRLSLVKDVRNLNEHRCSVLVENYEKYYDDYQQLLKMIDNVKASGRTYSKTNRDKEIEKTGKLAEFIKEHNYGLVREEVKLLYKKVVDNLPSYL